LARLGQHLGAGQAGQPRPDNDYSAHALPGSLLRRVFYLA